VHRLSATALFLVALALSLPSVASPAPAAPSAGEVARRVQRFYHDVRTFRARFKQIYRVTVSGVTKEASGQVVFARPGKMSFRYTSPGGDRVVSDGATVQIYRHEHKELYRVRVPRSEYPLALAFLARKAKLTRDFKLRLLDPRGRKVKDGYVLEAAPRSASPAFSKLLLWVDRHTAAVRRVLVVDAQGNHNRFEFIAPELDRPVADREFRLAIPPGTKVVSP
jgi:outer membrane lipoprotein carrier protein